MHLTLQDIRRWLLTDDEKELAELWKAADQVRRDTVGDAVHLRGLVEISSHCRRGCWYCGLTAANVRLPRYRMTVKELRECAAQAQQLGFGTLVLQSGEDDGLDVPRLADTIRSIKRDTTLAVTLSLGERLEDELRRLKRAGADRYLLRFETSNRELFQRIHPSAPAAPYRDRIELLRLLRRLDFEVGSGVMIGVPGQSYEDVARDIELFRQLDLDMIGVGPYIPHPNTPLAQASARLALPPERQAPATELMTYKVIALARIICPRANVPSTTALATLNRANGRELGLQRGANVVMPNLTPIQYRAEYEIYPNKACIRETATSCHGCLRQRIASLGRTIGAGRGDSPNFLRRRAAPSSIAMSTATELGDHVS